MVDPNLDVLDIEDGFVIAVLYVNGSIVIGSDGPLNENIKAALTEPFEMTDLGTDQGHHLEC